MRLVRYCVTNFRSVNDSGWIDADEVTALIGVNESGKTNLLLPLWKLNPAREGELQPTSDYPKKMFGEIREAPSRFCFVTAEFSTNEMASEFAELTGLTDAEVALVQVKRFFDGSYKVLFPKYAHRQSVSGREIKSILTESAEALKVLAALKQEEGLKTSLIQKVKEVQATISDSDDLSPEILVKVHKELSCLVPEVPAKTSVLVPQAMQILEKVAALQTVLSAPPPSERKDVVNAVVQALPAFVYYSNYGNLDSEIYLPHVVQNLERADLGAKEAAKARTLRVLFKFVRLEPNEILELGQDFHDSRDPNREPTPEEIAVIADKKRERSILLQAAGTTLTGKFKEWWKQGDYRFRFEADGNHFRIWVSDDRRPDEVELESRSTGLQWFLSFYLVFLVESTGDHNDAILLLDEPGMSLHPLAQRDLSAFFDNLSATNQLLYTTHSPFLVDADRLERARKVYIATDGTTKSTPDLRQGNSDIRQAGAAYAVHSALNLSVAESLLLGCQPVIVEGPSDQIYLTTIKALLIGAGRISPARELVFPPAGGTKTVRVVASILTGRDDELPIILLDGDASGVRMAKELRTGLYTAAPQRILSVDDFSGKAGSEIEDMIPTDFFGSVIDRWERAPDQEFSDFLKTDKTIIAQVEAWAEKHNLSLKNGWKVDVAKRVKTLALAKGIGAFSEETVASWVRLFEALLSQQKD